MKFIKYSLITILVLGLGLFIVVKEESYFSSVNETVKKDLAAIADGAVTGGNQGASQNNKTSSSSSSGGTIKTADQSVLYNVPFTSQAPTGNWKDIRQQDGCEEASSLMAVKWARGENLDSSKTESVILDISAYEQNHYGSFQDTSAKDTLVRIINGYFNFKKAVLKENINTGDIKKELYKGSIVIIPANGQQLGNPNYTAPGPDRHMLVVVGYDAKTGEFITNDPGTRKGKNYRYAESVMEGALRDYPTGNHLPIVGVVKKDMIVISK